MAWADTTAPIKTPITTEEVPAHILQYLTRGAAGDYEPLAWVNGDNICCFHSRLVNEGSSLSYGEEELPTTRATATEDFVSLVNRIGGEVEFYLHLGW